MKHLMFITGLIGMLGIAQADLIVIQDLGGIPLDNFINSNLVPSQNAINGSFQNQLSTIQNTTINANGLLASQSQSDFSPGKVEKHQILISLPMPIYLIGSDDQSIKWAKENANYLKSIHAQGFITNADSAGQIKGIEAKTGLILMPGNINGLSSLIGTSHYPFLIYKGWVTQ